MAVKDEIDIANMIMAKPKIRMNAGEKQPAQCIGGASKTGPNSEIATGQLMAEEVKMSDLRPQRRAKPSLSNDRKNELKEAMRRSHLHNTRQEPITEDMGFEESVESLFEAVNNIELGIEEIGSQTGRVGRKMVEEWDMLLKRLKRFELYYDRAMSKL